MRCLLDTHVLLWWLGDDPALSKPARDAIADGANEVFVSAATIWEIVIKVALNKLTVPADFSQVLAREPFEPLAITGEHAFAVGRLPEHHRDPFDRMLIAQAMVEGMTLVSHDVALKRYGVPVLGA